MSSLFETKPTNNEEIYCVYCHRNKINGKRYIGQTCTSPETRWRKNGKGYEKNSYFWSAIQKYGWDNFDHYVIQDNLTKEEADLLEDLNIRAFNTIDRNYGYNFKYGGSYGKHNEESKQKNSDAIKNKWKDVNYRQKMMENNPIYKGEITPWNKGKTNVYSETTRKKMSDNWNYDKHFSKETKQKLSESYKKYREKHPEAITKSVKAMNESRKHAIDMYDLENNYIQTFESIAEACKLGFSSSKISLCCSGKRKTHKGYIWKYHEEGGLK